MHNSCSHVYQFMNTDTHLIFKANIKPRLFSASLFLTPMSTPSASSSTTPSKFLQHLTTPHTPSWSFSNAECHQLFTGKNPQFLPHYHPYSWKSVLYTKDKIIFVNFQSHAFPLTARLSFAFHQSLSIDTCAMCPTCFSCLCCSFTPHTSSVGF